MQTQRPDEFDQFLGERRMIVEDIEQFLTSVLLYCVDTESNYNLEPYKIGTKHARSLILSLYKIHALYGYPTANVAPTDDSGGS